MIPDLDIYCSANVLVEHHGQDAPIHTAMRAMAAGVTDKLWDMKDVAALIDAVAPKPGPRGSYKRSKAN